MGSQPSLRAEERVPWRVPGGAFGIGAAIALAYVITAKASLLLAIPPGFATAVWPPAGISLAALVLFGVRHAPGVWVGSFVTNLLIGLDSGSTEGLVRSVVLAATIGLGAALQASLGTLLVRRAVSSPQSLAKDREILSFLALGGPCACLVGATVGVGALLVVGVIPAASAPFSWATWWVGDAIGVLIFAPLTIMWLQPASAWRGRRWLVTAPLVLTFAAAVAVFVDASASERAKLQKSFAEQAVLMRDALARRIEQNRQKIFATSAFFSTSREISRVDFARYAEVMLSDSPNRRALSWVTLVTDAERASFEEAQRAAGFASLGIFERGAGGAPVRAATRPTYTPVTYIHPLEGNEAALGFDLSSQSARRDALQRAARSHAMEVTAPIGLVQSGRRFDGVLFASRVSAQPDVTAPDAQLRGFVTMVVEPHQLIAAAFAESIAASHIHVTVEDRGADVQSHLLYAASSTAVKDDGLGLRSEHALPIGGRTWTLTFAPTLRYLALAKTPYAWLVLALGLAVCAMFGVGALILTGRTVVVEGVVSERTAQLADKVAQHERAERALDEERGFLKAVLENLHEGIVVLDQSGSVSLTNASARTMEGLMNGIARAFGEQAAVSVATQGPASTAPERSAPSVSDRPALSEPGTFAPIPRELLPFVRALSGEVVRDAELAARDADGRERVFVVTCQPLMRSSETRKEGAVCVVRDVTDTRAAERMKREFVSTVSHELRTPLTSIRGALSLLHGGVVGTLDRDAAELVELAERNAGRLLALINDLLDIDKLEAGGLQLDQVKQPLLPLLEQSVSSNHGYAHAHQVSLALCDVDGIADVWVNVDANRFLQVMANLISNAIKFSPAEGRVEVTAHKQGASVRVNVRDQGPGIPESFLPRIFEKFSQADASDTRAKGGTGLGLSISKGLVERMNGQIDFQTAAGLGTTFFVDLPLMEEPSERPLRLSSRA